MEVTLMNKYESLVEKVLRPSHDSLPHYTLGGNPFQPNMK
jgi:hypothetical protein